MYTEEERKEIKELKNHSIRQGMTSEEKDEFLARARSKFNRTIAKEQI
jgi:hypothetical protein